MHRSDDGNPYAEDPNRPNLLSLHKTFQEMQEALGELQGKNWVVKVSTPQGVFLIAVQAADRAEALRRVTAAMEGTQTWTILSSYGPSAKPVTEMIERIRKETKNGEAKRRPRKNSVRLSKTD